MLKILFTLLCIIPSKASLFGLGEGSIEPVKIDKWWLGKPILKPLDRSSVIVKLNIEEGYSVYSDKVKILPDTAFALSISELSLDPEVGFVDNAGKSHVGLQDKATVQYFIETPKGFNSKTDIIKFVLEYVACNSKVCLPKRKIEFGASGFITGSKTKQNSSPTSIASLQKKIKGDLVFAIIAVFLLGLLTSLTPCIYPLIPITLTVIGARAKDRSTVQSFTVSLCYVLGMATTYSILGVFAASTGSMFGQIFTYAPVIYLFAAIFFIMAIGMYGFFEIKLPDTLSQKLLSTSSNSDNFFSIFFMGLIAGLVASPCVGPVVVSILALVANTQDLFKGFVLLFSFAMGMGVLFLILGTLSSSLKFIPKSGGWMDIIKFALGTALVATSVFFIAPHLSSFEYFGTLVIAAIFTIGVAYKIFYKKMTWFFLCYIVLTALAFAAIAPKVSLTSPSDSNTTASKKFKDGWKPFSEEALKEAKENGKPVIVDFFADWCVACVELDELTFNQSEFKKASKDIVLLKVDATVSSQKVNFLLSKYQVYGLPTNLFFNNKGEQQSDMTIIGFETSKAFVERIERLKK